MEVRINANGRPDIMVGQKTMFRCMGNGQKELAQKMACAEELLEALEFCLMRVHKMLITDDQIKNYHALIKRARGVVE